MVKEVARKIEIPEGVDIQVADSTVTVKGPKGELSRRLWYPGIDINKEESHLVVNSKFDRKRQRAMVGTLAAHIGNMIAGVTEGFEYRMKVVYSHFPIQLKAGQDELIIGNFLGERRARSAKIVGGTKVDLGKDEVILSGIDKEKVGQTMANIEQATRVRGFDIRVFQDGIYLVEKR
ncbi:MAG: 50S ribosomal protein L6 [Methanotrichaceae archaeon]|jgi:large subunit ribosomal protein L6